MKVHRVRRHKTGAWKHHCSQCDKTFATGYELKRHLGRLDHQCLGDGEDAVLPEITVASTTVGPEEKTCCMYVEGCKSDRDFICAVSRFFGREAYPVQVPPHLWLHHCKNHYQMMRRDVKTRYPLYQLQLVKCQILRLQAWSDENAKEQTGPQIKQWALSPSKRESKRIENGGGTGEVRNDGHNASGTAIPGWLIQRVRSGYTTEEIMEVASRLYSAIKDGELSQVPEIEFLPDIVVAQ